MVGPPDFEGALTPRTAKTQVVVLSEHPSSSSPPPPPRGIWRVLDVLALVGVLGLLGVGRSVEGMALLSVWFGSRLRADDRSS